MTNVIGRAKTGILSFWWARFRTKQDLGPIFLLVSRIELLRRRGCSQGAAPRIDLILSLVVFFLPLLAWVNKLEDYIGSCVHRELSAYTIEDHLACPRRTKYSRRLNSAPVVVMVEVGDRLVKVWLDQLGRLKILMKPRHWKKASYTPLGELSCDCEWLSIITDFPTRSAWSTAYTTMQ